MSFFHIDLEHLTRMQRQWAEFLPQAFGDFAGHSDERLTERAEFGANSAGLRMLTYVPPNLPPGAPLVVVLHGCGQHAGPFDLETGWSALAEAHGFAVLYPEQTRQNNAQHCFNWFEPGDIAREMASVRAMIATMLTDHRCDPARVYITGFSAGGAMTTAMLATNPELFAAGAIIAGLPFGAATQAREALSAMARSPALPASEWGDKVRAAYSERAKSQGANPVAGRYPAVAIWHGDADTMVSPSNAIANAQQWTDVHCIAEADGQEDVVDGVPHRVWRDQAGRVCVELYAVPGLAHGVAIAPDAGGERGVGRPGRYVLRSQIASTWHIARAWNLAPADCESQDVPATPVVESPVALIGKLVALS